MYIKINLLFMTDDVQKYNMNEYKLQMNINNYVTYGINVKV